MTLDSDYPEYELVSNPLAGGGPTILQMVNALDHASRDRRVKGLVVDLENSSMTLGHIQELRAALIRFRKAGKFAYIYAPEYGEPGRGLGTYYLASAFSQIWMQPVGALSIAGISAEMPFARGLLDKVGIQVAVRELRE
jgi:protease-4